MQISRQMDRKAGIGMGGRARRLTDRQTEGRTDRQTGMILIASFYHLEGRVHFSVLIHLF
jgi:hypothetical protein